MAEEKVLSERWTKDVLRCCSPKEILAISAVYGVAQVAERLGEAKIAEYARQQAEQKI